MGIETLLMMIPKGGKYARSVVNFVNKAPENWGKFKTAIQQIEGYLKQGNLKLDGKQKTIFESNKNILKNHEKVTKKVEVPPPVKKDPFLGWNPKILEGGKKPTYTKEMEAIDEQLDALAFGGTKYERLSTPQKAEIFKKLQEKMKQLINKGMKEEELLEKMMAKGMKEDLTTLSLSKINKKSQNLQKRIREISEDPNIKGTVTEGPKADMIKALYDSENAALTKARHVITKRNSEFKYGKKYPVLDPENDAFIILRLDEIGNPIKISRFTGRFSATKDTKTGDLSRQEGTQWWDTWDAEKNQMRKKGTEVWHNTTNEEGKIIMSNPDYNPKVLRDDQGIGGTMDIWRKLYDKEISIKDLSNKGFKLKDIDMLVKGREAKKYLDAQEAAETGLGTGIKMHERTKTNEISNIMEDLYFSGDDIYKMSIKEWVTKIPEHFAEGGRTGFHRGSLRHQKEHDYQAYEDEGNFMKYLMLSGDRAKMSSPEHWINRLVNPNMKVLQARDDFETWQKERFMYGEHKEPLMTSELDKKINSWIKELFAKEKADGTEGLATGGRAEFDEGGGISGFLKKKVHKYTPEGRDEAIAEWLESKGIDLTVEEWRAKSLKEKLYLKFWRGQMWMPEMEKGTDYASGGAIPGFATGGISNLFRERQGYRGGELITGGVKLVKGARWLIKQLKSVLDDMIYGSGDVKSIFSKMPEAEKVIIFKQTEAAIKSLESGGPIPDEILTNLRNDARFKGLTVSKTADKDFIEIQEVVLGKLPKGKGEIIEGKAVEKVDLSKYTDKDLNALVAEDKKILAEANKLSQAGTNYGRVTEIEARRKEINEILEAAQKVPESGYSNFKADLALEKQATIGTGEKLLKGTVVDEKVELFAFMGELPKELQHKVALLPIEQQLPLLRKFKKAFDAYKAGDKEAGVDVLQKQLLEEFIPKGKSHATGGLIDGYATGGVSNLFRQRQGFRTGNIAKLPEFLKFVEGLLIKASNEIRQGIGKWKGLTTSQKVVQHDNLTKLATEFQKTKKFDVRINEYTGIDAEKAFVEAQAKVKPVKKTRTMDDLVEDAYQEVFYQKPRSGDYKYDADVLATEIAYKGGKIYDDLAAVEKAGIYDLAYKRVIKDLKFNMDRNKILKDVEQKMKLSDFDITGKKGNAEGGLIPGYATGGVSNLFRSR
jgi:hypothetical protein